MSSTTARDIAPDPKTDPLEQDVVEWELPGMQLHTLLDQLREQAPIVPVNFMGMPSWLITRHAELEQAFRDTENLPPERAYKFGIEPLIGAIFIGTFGRKPSPRSPGCQAPSGRWPEAGSAERIRATG